MIGLLALGSISAFATAENDTRICQEDPVNATEKIVETFSKTALTYYGLRPSQINEKDIKRAKDKIFNSFLRTLVSSNRQQDTYAVVDLCKVSNQELESLSRKSCKLYEKTFWPRCHEDNMDILKNL